MIARRLPVLDVYAEADRVVVMVGDRVVLLSELATTAYLAIAAADAPGPATELAELSTILVERYGPPETHISPESPGHEIVVALESHGLVHLSVAPDQGSQ